MLCDLADCIFSEIRMGYGVLGFRFAPTILNTAIILVLNLPCSLNDEILSTDNFLNNIKEKPYIDFMSG